MQILVVAVHVIVCFALIMIVLLQTGKGADIGAAFGGGSSQTLFGSSGAGNFLTKATTIAAIVFMFTSLTLAYMSSQKHQSSVMKSIPVKEEAPAMPVGGATPGMPPVADTGVIPKVPVQAPGAAIPAIPAKVPAANSASPVAMPQGVKVEATSTAKVTVPAGAGAKPSAPQAVKVTVPAAAPAGSAPAAPAAAQPAGDAQKAADATK